jgi:hypothetical protein
MKSFFIDSKKHGRFKVLVDDEDWDKVKNVPWIIHNSKRHRSPYAVGYFGKKNKKDDYRWAHRVVIDVPVGMEVDHIDGNGLNNQKSNLRICTHRENMQNRRKPANNKSGHKGVHWCKREEKWVAKLWFDGKRRHLGYFKTADEAGAAWNKKAKEVRKEFFCED